MVQCMLLYGMPNSGKSTIAHGMVQKRLRNVLVIDGDKHRQAQFLGEKLGFSREDIQRNTDHVIKLAQFAQDQGFSILIAQIAPYTFQRELMAKGLQNFRAVYCRCDLTTRAARANFVNSDLILEEGIYSGKPDLILHTDTMTTDECVDKCLEMWGEAVKGKV